MIRQVPGKTNEIIGPEITFGRSVAFRHRGWARQGLLDSRIGREFCDAASDGQSHVGINAATQDVPDALPQARLNVVPNHSFTCALAEDDSFHLLKSFDDGSGNRQNCRRHSL
jgi:hypothetical protein